MSKLVREYSEVLGRIKRAADRYSDIIGNPKPVISLMRVCVDEQDSDWNAYGVQWNEETGKAELCMSHDLSAEITSERRGVPVPAGKIAEYLEGHCRRGCKISPNDLVENFLEAIEMPIEEYETKRLGLEKKVKSRLNEIKRSIA
ncbi:MAG: hypothetical protein WCK90_02735 [archaeon]